MALCSARAFLCLALRCQDVLYIPDDTLVRLPPVSSRHILCRKVRFHKNEKKKIITPANESVATTKEG